MSRPLIYLHVDQIVVRDDNVRSQLGDIEELKASIETIGLLQPLAVQVDEGINRYVLVCGHRRLEACKQVGREEVPVVVLDVQGEAERIAIMLAENVARRSLSPIEIGRAAKRLADEHAVTQKEIAELLGCSSGHVNKCIKVLELPKRIRDLVHAGELSVDAALREEVWSKQKPRADVGVQRGWQTGTKLGYIKAVSALLKTKGPGGVRDDQPEVVDALVTLHAAIGRNELVAAEIRRRQKGAA